MLPLTLQKTLYAIMSGKQREAFERDLELDFAYSLPGQARFRVNVYRQRDSLGAAFRLIPAEIKPLSSLGCADVRGGLRHAAARLRPRHRTHRLRQVDDTGRSGGPRELTAPEHILTVEDPIEFLHSHKGCIVNQREVGGDTHDFRAALKHALRQDPDIIMVGEMRDLETIAVALTAAETGHLVFATLHTQDVAQTVDRIIDVFPPSQQQQIRVQLAGALQGIVCQQLVPTLGGSGRVIATEVLVATPAIRNLIREGKTHQVYSALQAGGKHGMQTMDSHLAELVRTGRVDFETALEKCHHDEDFLRLCGRA
jgi:twitching motility protein PilT